MSELVREVLGGKQVYDSGSETFSLSRERFFIVGGVWIALMEEESLPTRSYNHVAFNIFKPQLEHAGAAILRLGLEIKPSRPRVAGEGQSIYLYDFDNHLFELHTGTLAERLTRYAKGTTN